MLVDAADHILAIQSFTRRVYIYVLDDSADPPTSLVPTAVSLQVQRISTPSCPPGASVVLDTAAAASRLENPSDGVYYLEWGTAAEETADAGAKYLFVWNVENDPDEPMQEVQTVEVISPLVVDRLRAFRSQLDKMRKQYSMSLTDFCPLGYTDGQLLEYLKGGMTIINSYQPYPTWCDWQTFPDCYLQTLFDAGMIVGINAQALYAVDADLESWSNQGNQLVINHHPRLMAFSTMLWDRLGKLVPDMKKHFVRSGTAKIEAGANFRLQTLLNMAPSGALLRNTFTR